MPAPVAGGSGITKTLIYPYLVTNNMIHSRIYEIKNDLAFKVLKPQTLIRKAGQLGVFVGLDSQDNAIVIYPESRCIREETISSFTSKYLTGRIQKFEVEQETIERILCKKTQENFQKYYTLLKKHNLTPSLA